MAIIWNTFVVYENLVPNVNKQLIIMVANNYRTPDAQERDHYQRHVDPMKTHKTRGELDILSLQVEVKGAMQNVQSRDTAYINT